MFTVDVKQQQHNKNNNMEISDEKTILMPNSANGIQREIKVKGHVLCIIISGICLEAVVCDDGSQPEIFETVTQATAAHKKLKPI